MKNPSLTSAASPEGEGLLSPAPQCTRKDLPKLMKENKDRSRTKPGLLALTWEKHQLDRLLPQVSPGPSLGCGHIDDHKALDVREL